MKNQEAAQPVPRESRCKACIADRCMAAPGCVTWSNSCQGDFAAPAPQEPAPMTREWCAAYPGAAAGIINRLARQVDATRPVATGYAEGKVHMAPSVAPQEPAARPCCQDFEACSKACAPRAHYWQGQAEQLRRAPQEPAEPVAWTYDVPETGGYDFTRNPDVLRVWQECGYQITPLYDRAQSVADAQDAWLEKLFVRKWNGVIDSGSRFNWELRGDWRHYIKNMEGETFARAIESAITKRDPKGGE
jgi:hypothetical protein